MSDTKPLAAPGLGDGTARVERLFLPLASTASKVARGLALLGSALLGAGVYGQWLAPEPVTGATALLVGGIVAIAAASFLRTSSPPVRVGELGVMLGEPTEARRVHWCDIEAVRLVGEDLTLTTAEGPIRVPLAGHAPAASRIVAEAALRVPARVELAPKAHERLPALSEAEGELVPAARLQLAGRKCAESGKSITFEADARLCGNCAALYHASHVPAECLRCQRPLGVQASAGSS